ncbi:hypothetical protein E4T39_02375 [Aureobasidium subglaciale]|nr:hypothetical protein E4T39_02375 [Aureobasidium subglaciale]
MSLDLDLKVDSERADLYIPEQSEIPNATTASSSSNGNRWMIWQHVRYLADSWHSTIPTKTLSHFAEISQRQIFMVLEGFPSTSLMFHPSSDEGSPPECVSTVKGALAKSVTSDSMSSPRFITAPTNEPVC